LRATKAGESTRNKETTQEGDREQASLEAERKQKNST